MRIVVPFVVGLGVIYFGTRVGSVSASQSSFVTNILRNLGFLESIDFSLAMFLVRKMAHMFEYAMFGLTFDWSLSKRSSEKAICAAFLASFSLASLDELFQYTNIGRSGCVQDVLIDVLGACVGIAIFNLFRRTDA